MKRESAKWKTAQKKIPRVKLRYREEGKEQKEARRPLVTGQRTKVPRNSWRRGV
jgi:hypothetical protein